MSLDAMKQALEALEELADEVFAPYDNKLGDAILALRAAIEQAQRNEFNPDWDALSVMVEEQQRMAKRIDELEAQQKPWVKTYAGGKPNYTTPEEQTRQWQGLTEAEKVNVAIDCGCADVAWMDFADAIEAKLKEKNA